VYASPAVKSAGFKTDDVSKGALEARHVKPASTLVLTADGRYLRAVGIFAPASGPPKISLATDVSAKPVAKDRLTEDEALQAGIKVGAPQMVVVGFFGGTFSKGSQKVTVVGAEYSKKSITHVLVRPTGSSGRRGKPPAPVREAIVDFLDAYEAPQVEIGSPAPAHDLARLKSLVAALRVLKVLPGDSTEIDLAKLTGIASAAAGETLVGRVAVLAECARVDAELKADKSALSVLKAAFEEVADDNLSVEDVGGMLNLSKRSNGKAAKPVGAGAATGTAPVMLGGSDSEDESDSGDSDSDADDDDAAPPRAASKRTAAAAALPPSASDGSSDGGHATKRACAKKAVSFCDLSFLTPPTITKLEAAAILFKEAVLRDAVGVPEPPAEIDTEEVAAMEFRYSKALKRLREKVPEGWVPAKKPKTTADLRMVREAALEALWSKSSTAPALGDARAARADGEQLSSTPASALTPQVQARAVSADVAARLHAHAAEISLPMTAGSDVGAGVRMAPAHLRDDLARAVCSNGKVDAAGEQQASRTKLPAVAQRAWRVHAVGVQEALMAVPEADESARQCMDPDDALELAYGAVAGDFSLPKYIAAVRGYMVAPPPKDSLEELRAGWQLLKAGISNALTPMYASAELSSAVQAIDNCVYATADSTSVDTEALRQWLMRVLKSFGQAHYKFRLVEGEAPNLRQCLRAHRDYLTEEARIAALETRLAARLTPPKGQQTGKQQRQQQQQQRQQQQQQQQRPSRRSGRVDKRSDRRSNGRGAGRRGGKKRRGQQAGSDTDDSEEGNDAQGDDVEPPKVGNIKDFKAFRTELRDTFPKVCGFFLTGKCTKGASCTWEHSIPDGYAALLKKHQK